jgi:hypothetical protein
MESEEAETRFIISVVDPTNVWKLLSDVRTASAVLLQMLFHLVEHLYVFWLEEPLRRGVCRWKSSHLMHSSWVCTAPHTNKPTVCVLSAGPPISAALPPRPPEE